MLNSSEGYQDPGSSRTLAEEVNLEVLQSQGGSHVTQLMTSLSNFLPPDTMEDNLTLTLARNPGVDNSYRIFKIVFDVYVVVFLCIFGVSGNVVSILVLGRDRVVRRTTGFLLQNLAFTDIMYLISCIFFQTLNTINHNTDWLPSLKYHWPYMEPYVWAFASIAQTCTVWLVVVVTADRYVAICKPLHAPQYSTMSRMRKAVIIVWSISILYNVPRFFERGVRMKFNNITNLTEAETVRLPMRNNQYYVIIYKTVSYFILRLLVPLTSLAFFNTKLIQAIRESYRQRREMPHCDHSNQRREKYSLTLVVVVVVFITCETPDLVLRIWLSLHSFISSMYFPKKILKYVNVISNTFLAVNSCSNFVIYCFIGSRFRRILLEILGKKKPQKPRIVIGGVTTHTHTHTPTNAHTQTYRFSSSQWERNGEEMSILVSTANG
uniref:Orphan G-protein coupled receptor 47 n=1 Tax=Platynereis dumerilii TaxID=6359 RepID=A0A0K0PVQ4_PLADU|nr:orphan G-protein coupled receptor 47 [Platynereis dumerilii]